jgi:hypothetical protein
MDWLGQQLGIRCPSDWYRVSNQDFRDRKGGAFLIHYDSTVSRAIMSYLPEYDWKEWMFDWIPKGFWRKKRNRKRYMMWLGKTLGLKSLTDWYSVTGRDFQANYGGEFLEIFGGSPLEALRDCFPKHTWNEWMFARVPVGFWDSLENRRRYLRWLGKKLDFKKPRDWCKVTRNDFRTNYGGGLLFRYQSYNDLLKECIPGFKPGLGAPS